MSTRMIAKVIVVIAEVAGLIVLTALAAGLALMLRLQQGPLPLDMLTTRLERAFAGYQNGFVFDIGRTTLIWGDHSDPFVLETRDVRVKRSDKTPVAVISRARVVLSKRGLLLGRIIPKEFYLYSPVVRVVRSIDGSLSLNVGHGGALPTVAAVEKAWDDTVEPPKDIDTAAQRQFVTALMAQMRAPEWHGLLGGLSRITVDDAALAYDDRILNVVWRAENAKIVFAKTASGIVADTVFRGSFGAADTQPAVIRLRARHVWAREETDIEAFFAGINPALLARQSEKLSVLNDINIPMKGRVALTLDDAMRPYGAQFQLAGEAGSFNAAELYAAPVAIKTLALDGNYDMARGTGEITAADIDFGGPRVRATVNITRVMPHTAADGTTTDTSGQRIAVQGTLSDMPMNDLARYWSAKLAPDAQKWVTTNLTTGIAKTATVDVAVLRDNTGGMTVEKLGGVIDFSGLSVNYFPPMPQVTAVDGQAEYDADSFNIKVTAGKLGDINVTGGQVDITKLGAQSPEAGHARIDIAVALQGPLKTALQVIDSKPLQYPSSLGLVIDGVKGEAKTDVTFAFPLHHKLTINEVAVTAKSVISDAHLPDVALGQGLRGGPFTLALDQGRLTVKGDGHFGAAPIKLDWARNFSDAAAPAMELAATLTAPANMLLLFGVPEMLAASGFLPAKLTLVERQDGTGTLMLNGDLTPLGFTVSALGASKAEGEPGTLALELDMKNQQPVSLRRIAVDAPALTLAGRVDFSGSGDALSVSRLGLSSLRYGKTELNEVTASFAPGAAAYDVTVKGAQFDAGAFFAPDDTPNSDAAAAKKTTPLSLAMTVDRLLTAKDRALERVTLRLMRNDYARIEQLELDAVAGGKPVVARYLPVAAGGKSLRFEAGNAGAALAALGVTSAIQGGQIVLDGKPAVKPDNARETARDMNGSVVLSNFEVRNAPVLAKLLNAMSLSGIYDLLNNKGLSFKRARVRFAYSDRGQPVTDRNQRLVRLSDGQTSGASLGLMFEGAIDLWRKVYDLNGTIVPVSDLNNLLEKIPLLGDVLTAGGEGIFAATYTIKGPQKDPDVSVNPLSVLAPGVLRKIFFED